MKIPAFLARNPGLRISLIYALAAGAWILFSDHLLEALTGGSRLVWLQTAKGVAFVMVTAWLLYWLVSPVARLNVADEGNRKLKIFKPLLIFFLLALGIGITGRLSYVSLRDQMLHESVDQITGVGKLKKQQLEIWIKETVRDGELLTRNSMLSNDIARWIAGGTRDQKLKAQFSQRLLDLASPDRYSGLILFDHAGKVLISTNLAASEITQHRHDVMNAITHNKTLLVDFHFRDEGQQKVELGLASPLLSNGRVIGAMYFSIDPEQYLYPMIEAWPTRSETAETLLVRKDNETIVYLNKLRHRQDLPMTFRLPKNQISPATYSVVQGHSGFVEGEDYRKVPVLAYAAPINGTAWHIVSKIDREEALNTVHHLALITTLASLLLMVVASVIALAWWRREIARIEQVAEMEKAVLAKHFDYLSRFASDIILLTDETGRILEANDHAVKIYGYSREEFIGMSVAKLRADSSRADLPMDLAHVVNEKARRYEVLHKTRDGREFPVEVNARLIESEGRRFIHAILRDVTERRALLNKLQTAYAVVESSPAVLWRWAATEGWPTEYVSQNVLQFGYRAEEFLSGEVAFASIIHPDDIGRVMEEVKRHSAGGLPNYDQQYRIKCRDGNVRWLDDRTIVIRDAQGVVTHYQGITTDITDRKLAEEQVGRMSRFYAATAMVNESLVRHWHAPESELMGTICRVAVEQGGMKMAWLGTLDPKSRRVLPVASFGEGREYLDDIDISIDGNIPQGLGPTGTSLREGVAVTINDYLGDPRTDPWHARGAHFGWGSSAAFPILRNRQPYAVLTVYHGDKNAFDAPTQSLMMEMAGNIGFALDIFDSENLRTKLQNQLAHVLEISPACIYTLTPAGFDLGVFQISFVSPNIELVTGYPITEWLSKPGLWAEQIHPDDLPVALDVHRRLLQEGQAVHHFRFRHADGSYRWINDQLILLRNSRGEPQEIIGAWTDSTELMLAQQFVQESEHRLTLLLGNLPGMAFRCANDQDWSMQFVSQGCEALTGYPAEALLYNYHIAYNDLILEEDRQMVFDQVQAALQTNTHYQITYRIQTAQQQIKHVWEQGVGVHDEQGQLEAIEGLAMDVTARIEAEHNLKSREEQLRSLGDNLPDGYVYRYELTADGHHKFHYISAGVEKIHGIPSSEVIANPERIFAQMSERTLQEYATIIEKSRNELSVAHVVLEIVLPEDKRRWVQVQSRPHRSADGATIWDGIALDVTQSRNLQERVAQLTRFDPATGLPNQDWFKQLLAEALSSSKAQNEKVALVRIDIDNFVDMEDQLGLESSDAALKEIAGRISISTGKDSLAARLDKSSFALALLHITNAGTATQTMQNLLTGLIRSIALPNAEFIPLIRIGASFYPSDATTPGDLLHQANLALSQGREEKVSSLRFFTQEMNDLLQTKIALINDIRRAIEENEFELYYLPQVDIASGRVVGTEALIRWNHPRRGFLPPSEFLSLAEESGQIIALGSWIVKSAIRQTKIWHDAGQTELAVTVNASSLQTESGELIDLLLDELKQAGLPITAVELELNEKALSSSVSKTQLWMQKLKSVHVQLSIDGFGTGYSSLFYLKQFSVDKIKIDKSFIDDITTDHNNAVIVQATIAMSHGLGLKVVAEGVETQAQANYLRTLHCDQIQGFLYSPPVKAEAILPMLRGRSAPVVEPSSNKRTLLLVDDEPNVISSLKRILRRDGYEILTASSGQEALHLLAQHPVKVIVSDQRMPAMTGTEFLSRVKVMHPNTMRIILSGYTEVNTITEAVNKGEVYKFLTKPWDDNELRSVIQEAFQRQEIQTSQEKK